MDPLTTLRLSQRLGISMGATLGLWACMDIETAVNRRDDPLDIQHKWVGRWARRVLDTIGVEVQAEGEHVAGGGRYPGRAADGLGRLFILNHRSAIDIFLTFALTEGHLVSRHDLADWPVVGRGAKRLGTLFVDRNSMVSGASVLKLMTKALEQGMAMRRPRMIEEELCDETGRVTAAQRPFVMWGGEPLDGSEPGPPVYDLEGGGRMGWASLEMRSVRLGPLRAGAHVQSFGAPVEINKKTSCHRFWIFDLDSGKPLLANDVVDIALNLDERRAMEIPDRYRADLERRLRADLR